MPAFVPGFVPGFDLPPHATIDAAASPVGPRGAAPDFAAMAARYREQRGLAGQPSGREAVEAALASQHARLELGLFDLRYPWAALADEKRGDELREIALVLIDVQARWLAWLDGREKERKPATPEPLATVRKWVAGWKSSALRAAAGERAAHPDFAAIAGASPAVNEAIAAMRSGMRSGSLAGLALEGVPTLLVLAPSRSEFNGFAAFVGESIEQARGFLWTSTLTQRIEFHLDDLVCLALEHPAPGGGEGGVSMSEREKTGLLQHVAQYAGDRLVRHFGRGGLDSGLHMGVAVDLVIDVVGENNSRVFGDHEGNSTPERRKFVVGGRDGGKLAKLDADGVWRAGRGADHFVKILHDVQKEAGKVASKEIAGAPKDGSFLLFDRDSPGENEIVTAPFLGDAAGAKAVASNYLADYQEFLRAYRSAFVHWAQHEFAVKPPVAGSPFARLLHSAATEPGRSLAERVEEAFGVPLTSDDPKQDALEWRFLLWLAKQR
jgi:hypothetical protein